MSSLTFQADPKVFEVFLRERYGFQNVEVEEIKTFHGGRFRIHNITPEGINQDFICKVLDYDPQHPLFSGVYKVVHPAKTPVVMRHLLKCGVRCCEPKPSMLGNDAETYEDPHKIAIVYTYLPGSVLYGPNFDCQDRYDFGVLAGHFRCAMESFQHEAFPTLTAAEIIEREELPNLLRMCEAVEEAERREMLGHILRGSLEKIEKQKETLAIGVCHRDLWPGNVILLDDSRKDSTPLEKLALIDFDACGTTFLVFDFSNTFFNDLLQGDSDDIASVTRPIADGYCSVCSVTEDEKRTVQFALCYQIVKFLLLLLHVPPDDPNPGWQFLRGFNDRLFHRLQLLWEADSDDLYAKWFH